MEIKIANNNSYTFDEVMQAQNNGGSFVTYQWIIPLPLFYPVRRFSKVYFIPAGENKSKHAARFNIITLIIGWWGFPWGPIFVMRSLNINNSGGVDVSDDVYLNLDKSGYENGRFQLLKSNTQFIHPPKSELKEYQKVFKSLNENGTLKSLPVIGLFVDTDEGIEPYTIIGIYEEIDGKEELISKAIYKRFYKQHSFELVSLKNNEDLKEVLITQGIQL